MKKIIDSNKLQSEHLQTFLSRSPNHIAVLTDYVMMEAYKSDDLDILYQSIEILSGHPNQVIIVKGTQAVCGLSGRAAGLQRRLIDIGQTRDFSAYCKALIAARQGDQRFRTTLLHRAREARFQMDRILGDAKGIGAIVEDLVKSFDKEDLDRIRRGLPYTDQMIKDFLGQVVITARNMFGNHPRVMKLPSMRELPNTFIFRTALCAHLLARRWISVGGPHKTSSTKIRNDIIDVNFAAFATYFDGFLSNDGNANDIYTKSNFILREIILPLAANTLRESSYRE